jgi:hypothetical protein
MLQNITLSLQSKHTDMEIISLIIIRWKLR